MWGGQEEEGWGGVCERKRDVLSFAKTREITPHPVRGPPTFPRGLHCQPTPTTRDMCINLHVSSCVELPRQGAGKGSKFRSHLSVVEMGSRQVWDANNLNTLIPAVHHHTTTAADCNTVRIAALKFMVKELLPC